MAYILAASISRADEPRIGFLGAAKAYATLYFARHYRLCSRRRHDSATMTPPKYHRNFSYLKTARHSACTGRSSLMTRCELPTFGQYVRLWRFRHAAAPGRLDDDD